MAQAAPVAAGPAGAAFYVPPAPLPPGAAGTPIWTRPLDGTMALPSAASNTLVLYRATDAAGAIVPVSGTLSVPPGPVPSGGWPVLTWTHGTTGLGPQCAPSLDTADGPEHPYIADIQALLDGFIRAGYAVVATDYQGLGVAGFHPFMQGVPTGRNALDLVRAARQLNPDLGARYAVVGHSQGGQVDLFAAAQGPQVLSELKLVGNVAFAPGSHIAEWLAKVMADPAASPALPYVMYVLSSYAHDDPAIDLTRILTPEAIAHLPDLFVGCMSRATSTGYWSTAIARDQFVATPDTAAFLAKGRLNEPGLQAISVPTLIVQGTADTTVPPLYTDDVARQLCAGGVALTYLPAPGATHDGAMAQAAPTVRTWLDARFAGTAATSNCGALPKAATP
ncbi:MAG: lipase [Rhizobiales bacterium 32-66-8]|nr:MAG: lipase [Rhizobiales bacterium 32-66-8]